MSIILNINLNFILRVFDMVHKKNNGGKGFANSLIL